MRLKQKKKQIHNYEIAEHLVQKNKFLPLMVASIISKLSSSLKLLIFNSSSMHSVSISVFKLASCKIFVSETLFYESKAFNLISIWSDVGNRDQCLLTLNSLHIRCNRCASSWHACDSRMCAFFNAHGLTISSFAKSHNSIICLALLNFSFVRSSVESTSFRFILMAA